MKKVFLIFLISALALTGCEEETLTYVDPPIQLDITSRYVIFDACGGSKTVLVTSNDDWEISYDASWFSAVRDDGFIEISVRENTSGANRQAYVAVTAGGAVTDSVSVAQFAAAEYGDLSSGGAANCYVARTESACRFTATVKGNGLESGLGAVGAYIDLYGTDIGPGEIIYSDLLWEAVFDGDRTRSADVIDGRPIYRDGCVYFTTGQTEGNAVIAVRDARGTVLWSWHIWVTDSEIGETYGNGRYWQDRNLGALSNEPEDIDNRGLFYQWGRKDPFLPSCGAYGAAEPDVLNTQVGNGSGTWEYGSVAKLEDEAPGNLPLSIEKPMTFLAANPAVYVYSWYMTADNDPNNANYLWGDSSDLSAYVKSIFDPCPPGYNVPVYNPWDDTSAWTPGADGLGLYWTGGGDAYYPFTGALNGRTGALVDTGLYGYCWTSAMSPTTFFARHLNYNTESVTYTLTYPVHAMPVRCMRTE